MKRILKEDLEALNVKVKRQISEKSNRPVLNINCLIEVLKWIKRIEMADSTLSRSSQAFKQLCWAKLHEKVKPQIIKKLKFSYKRNDEGILQCILRKNDENNLIPIASIQPPKYIIGIQRIDFNFVNDQALKFVQAILPLLSCITISINFRNYENGFEKCPKIRRLMCLLARKTYKLKINRNIYEYLMPDEKNKHELAMLNRDLSNFIDSLQLICIELCTQVDMDDVLSKWLKVPARNGKPKLLNILEFDDSFIGSIWMDRLKKEFSNSTEPANFIIQINEIDNPYDEAFSNFKLENEIGEILELDTNLNDYHFIIRHPADDYVEIEDCEKQFKRKLGTMLSMP